MLRACSPAAVSAAVSSTYVGATNTLILQGNIAGKIFSTVILPPRNFLGNLIGGVDFNAPTSVGDPAYTSNAIPQPVLKKITLKGAANVASGSFLYTLTTTSTNASCTLDSINGLITVNAATTVSLTSGNVSQSVCDGNPMSDIVYTIENSSSVDLASLKPLL